jgi:acetamidase/formamidase
MHGKLHAGLLAGALVLPGLLSGAVETATQKTYYHHFAAGPAPVKRVQPGAAILTKTLDAAGGDQNGVIADPKEIGNPLSGPFYVEGAEPGDALLVHITRLRMNRNWGWTGFRLGEWALPPGHTANMPEVHYKAGLVHKGEDRQVPWDLDLKTNMVRLSEPVSRRMKFEFPARPMLGCIGVAAPGNAKPDSSMSGAWGGNMDYNAVGEGATVILPVFHPGALLYFGDGHALQGDGEPTGQGIETSFNVEVKLELVKHAGLTGPRVETAEEIISLGSQQEYASVLDRSLQLATADMLQWLVAGYGFEPWAAHVLVTTQARYQVVTVAGSMALRIPKRYLPPPLPRTAPPPAAGAQSFDRGSHPAVRGFSPASAGRD